MRKQLSEKEETYIIALIDQNTSRRKAEILFYKRFERNLSHSVFTRLLK